MADTVLEYIIELTERGDLTRNEYGKLLVELMEGSPLDYGKQHRVFKEAEKMARKVKGPKKLLRRKKAEVKD